MTTNEIRAAIQAQAVKTAEAARRLSLSEKSVRNLVKKGLLRPNRKTRHLLFDVEELQKFIKS